MIIVLTTMSHYENYLDIDFATRKMMDFSTWIEEQVREWAKDYEFMPRFCRDHFHSAFHLPFEVEDDAQAVLLKMVWG